MKVSGGLNIDFVDEVPIIINGYWHEWINGEWVNTGQKATGVDAIDIHIDNANLVVTEANGTRNYTNTGFKIRLSQGGWSFEYFGGPINVDRPRTWRCDVSDSANITGFNVPIQLSEDVYEAIFLPITTLTGDSGYVTLRLDIRDANGVRQFVDKRIQYTMSGANGSDAIDIHIDNANLVVIENNGVRNYSNTGFSVKLSQGGWGIKYYGQDIVVTEARSWTCEILESHNISGFTPPGPFPQGVDTAVFPPITGITGDSGYVVLRFHIRDIDTTYQYVERRILYNIGGKGDKGDPGDSAFKYQIPVDWLSDVQYRITSMGVPVVKVEDGTSMGFSVYSLKQNLTSNEVGKKPGLSSWAWSSFWELMSSQEYMYIQESYIERLQAALVTAEKIQALNIKTGNLEALNGAKIGNFEVLNGILTATHQWSTYIGTTFVFVTSRIEIRSDEVSIFNSYGGTTDHPTVVEWYSRVTPTKIEVGQMEVRRDGIYRNGVKVL